MITQHRGQSVADVLAVLNHLLLCTLGPVPHHREVAFQHRSQGQIVRQCCECGRYLIPLDRLKQILELLRILQTEGREGERFDFAVDCLAELFRAFDQGRADGVFEIRPKFRDPVQPCWRRSLSGLALFVRRKQHLGCR